MYNSKLYLIAEMNMRINGWNNKPSGSLFNLRFSTIGTIENNSFYSSSKLFSIFTKYENLIILSHSIRLLKYSYFEINPMPVTIIFCYLIYGYYRYPKF